MHSHTYYNCGQKKKKRKKKVPVTKVADDILLCVFVVVVVFIFTGGLDIISTPVFSGNIVDVLNLSIQLIVVMMSLNHKMAASMRPFYTFRKPNNFLIFPQIFVMFSPNLST